MKPETKICKHCQSEIPYAAKVCPQCQKRVKGGKLKWFVIAIVVIAIIGSVSGGGSKKNSSATRVGSVNDSKPSDVSEPAETVPDTEDANTSETEQADSAPAEEESAEEIQTVYHVGDILMDGDVKIVYMSSGEYKSDNQFSQPTEGNKYIYLQFAFENTSDSQDHSISFYSFDCYADGYSADAYYGGDENLGATLSAGRTTTGYLYFEVPEDATDIEVEYESNWFTDEKITFVYEGEQDSGYVAELNTAATADAFSVGDVVEAGDLTITYLSCEEYKSDNAFTKPKDGNYFVTCTFEFENTGNHDEIISAFSFDCYADGVACDQTFIRDDNLSATISAGRKAKGTVTFEVPKDAAVVEVEFLTNYWTSNRIVFTVQ